MIKQVLGLAFFFEKFLIARAYALAQVLSHFFLKSLTADSQDGTENKMFLIKTKNRSKPLGLALPVLNRRTGYALKAEGQEKTENKNYILRIKTNKKLKRIRTETKTIYYAKNKQELKTCDANFSARSKSLTKVRQR